MNVIDSHFVGPPCGHHGPYTFYKAFAYNKSGKYKILSLGEFFFLKISSHELCIGELQLLWEDRNNRLSLSSSRLYFLPEDTIDDGQTERGQDEVLAMSEKAVVRLENLVEWITPDVRWNRGLDGIWEPPSSSPTKMLDGQSGTVENGLNTKSNKNSSNNMTTVNNIINKNNVINGSSVKYIHSPSVSKNGELANHRAVLDEKDLKDSRCCNGCVATASPASSVTVLSYPQYCRYRAILKRLENVGNEWVKNSIVKLLGGLTFPTKNHKILFCRETVDKPELEQHESFCNHLAPNLKGRPRKKRLKNSRGHSPSSESNTSEEARDMKETLRRKLTKIKIQTSKNGLKPRSQRDVLEEEEFLEKLFKFMRERNTPIERVPHLGFKQINLYLFYTYTQNLGGYDRVTGKKLWKQIYDGLGGSPGSTSAATCTRRHYERLLLPYERHVKGEEDKPLPPPVKHRRPSQASHKGSSEKATLNSSQLMPIVLPYEEGKFQCPPSSPESCIKIMPVRATTPSPPPPVTLPCTDGGSPYSASEANLCTELSSSLPSSSCTVPSLTPPSPCIESKLADPIISTHSDTEPSFDNENTWEQQKHLPRKRSRDLSLSDTEKKHVEKLKSNTEELSHICPTVPSSLLSPPVEPEEMPHLSSYLVSTKDTSNNDQTSFPSGDEPPSFSHPSNSSQSPPPLLPVQINKSSSPLSSLSTHSIDNPSPSQPQSPTIDHLPSPPPLVDLTRVVNSLPVVTDDLKSLPLPVPRKSFNDIQDLSSAKRFRTEDAENIHPESPRQLVGYSHSYSLLPQMSEATNTSNSTTTSTSSLKAASIDNIHPYSLPFSYINQMGDKQRIPTLTPHKMVHERTQVSSSANSSHGGHNGREMPPLISRPSVIQHTQKANQSCSPSCFQNDMLRSDVHHVSIYDSPIAHRQSKTNELGQRLNVKKEMNGITPAVTSPNGSVQYYYQQYYQQHNAHVSPSSQVISLTEPYLDYSKKSHVDPPTLSSPQYYPAPKLFLQSQNYRDSSYVDHYLMCDDGDDEVLDLSLKKTKEEKKDDDISQASVQRSFCVKFENSIEYERITPPEKELDLSIKQPKIEPEKDSLASSSIRCPSSDAPHNSVPFSKNDENHVDNTEHESRRIITGDKSKPHPESGSPAGVASSVGCVKNEETKLRTNCQQPFCSSANCFPCLGKQAYYSSHLPSSYYSSSVYGFHPQFLLSSSRYLHPDHVPNNLAAYKDVFHPSLFGGPYSYSITSQLYPHLYKESQPYLYQPK